MADVLSFLLFVAVSRAFGPGGTGQYSYAFAIGSLVALASTSGFEEFGIREYVRSEGAARTRLWSDILSTQCAQLMLALVGLVLFLAFSHGGSAPVAIILELALFQIAASLARTLFIPAMAAQAMMAPALLELGSRVTGIALALLIITGPHPPELTLALIPFPAASALLLILAYRNSRSHGARWHLELHPRVWLSTWRGTMHFAGSETLNQFYARTDLLMIAYFLGEEHVGLYATDIKFVEVGIVPLTLLGTALYPVLSMLAAGAKGAFAASARDFCRFQLVLSGWLAVGIALLLPLLIVPLFGERFASAAELLPWFALLAVAKGWEVALYRLLYSVHRQAAYFHSLALGVAVIALLNVLLIPRIGVIGAVQAAVLSTFCVAFACARGLVPHVPVRVFLELAARSAAALVLVWGLVMSVTAMGAAPWLRAALGCCLYPVAAMIAGLIPNPGRSPLLAAKREPVTASFRAR